MHHEKELTEKEVPGNLPLTHCHDCKSFFTLLLTQQLPAFQKTCTSPSRSFAIFFLSRTSWKNKSISHPSTAWKHSVFVFYLAPFTFPPPVHPTLGQFKHMCSVLFPEHRTSAGARTGQGEPLLPLPNHHVKNLNREQQTTPAPPLGFWPKGGISSK